ncbi:hypothetical protein FRC11_013536, partial [Ceratobasidium sp. 423]
FLSVDVGTNQSPIRYVDPILSRPPQCRLTWTAQEKTYALKVATAARDSLQKPTWSGLPPARLEHVYEPFSASLKTQMSNACQAEYKGAAITSLVFAIERYGPVHTRDASVDEPLNGYISEDTSDKSIEHLLLQEELRPAALLEDDPLHTELSLMSFICYAKTTVRLRHPLSQTWRAGPYGVRWLVAIYIFFGCAFSLFELCRDELSTDTILALESCNFRRLKAALISFGDWLLKSLQDSITVLKQTFEERAQAWRTATVSAHLAHPDDNIGNESVRLDTHGIPRSRATLRACYNALQNQDPDLTFGLDDLQFNQERTYIRQKADWENEELSDRDSTSGEEIQIPDFESEDSISEDSISEDDWDKRSDSVTRERSMNCSGGIRDITRYLSGDIAPTSPPYAEEVPSHSLGSPVATRLSSESIDNTVGQLDVCESTGNETWESDREERNIAAESEPESDGENLLPRSILTNISPVKLKPVTFSSKPRTKMTMEVVIPTPRKRPTTPSNVADSGEGSAGNSPTDDLSKSVANRRGKRTNKRSDKVEEAIRSASKGWYRPKN